MQNIKTKIWFCFKKLYICRAKVTIVANANLGLNKYIAQKMAGIVCKTKSFYKKMYEITFKISHFDSVSV